MGGSDTVIGSGTTGTGGSETEFSTGELFCEAVAGFEVEDDGSGLHAQKPKRSRIARIYRDLMLDVFQQK
jgi:hypothetical protein